MTRFWDVAGYLIVIFAQTDCYTESDRVTAMNLVAYFLGTPCIYITPRRNNYAAGDGGQDGLAERDDRGPPGDNNPVRNRQLVSLSYSHDRNEWSV